MSTRAGTLIGCTSVVIWSLSILLLIQLRSVPVIPLVGLLYLSSSIPSIVKLTLTKRWKGVHRNWKKWAYGILLLSTFQFCVTMGVRKLHPAASELIVQLWPLCIVLLVGFLPRETFSSKYLIPIFIGGIGIWVLFWNQSQFLPITWAILYPICACCSWSCYVLFSRYHRRDAPEMIGLYLGVGGAIALAIYFGSGGRVLLSSKELGCLVILGVGVLGVAQLMWDHGIKKGDIKVMSIFANFNPALAIAWLIAFGYAKTTLNLLISYGLILVATLYAYFLSFNERKSKHL
ncbi:MAG: DMT family transporter [Simkaniaceae bacterium]|nr:DMT family transporter [Simkaniaceae bacterium]